MQRYQLIEPRGNRTEASTLGEGAYGVVYKALDLQTKRYVALKKIRVETEFDGIAPSTLREITLLMQLNHENVVKLENVVMDKERMSLIFELLDMDLKKLMDNSSEPLPQHQVQLFAAQLLRGLEHCHSMGVMHRDLKPHNILISSNGSLKIADFGLARAFTPFHRQLTTEVITRWYRAPEILLGYNKYNASVDLWSVGCILAEMSNNQALLTGDSDIDQLHKIFRLQGTPSAKHWSEIENLPYYRSTFPKWNPIKMETIVPNLSLDGVDLLLKLFQYDPSKRITAKLALKHPFITNPQVVDNDHRAASPTISYPVPNKVTPEAITDFMVRENDNEEEVLKVDPEELLEEEKRGTGERKRKAEHQISRKSSGSNSRPRPQVTD